MWKKRSADKFIYTYTGTAEFPFEYLRRGQNDARGCTFDFRGYAPARLSQLSRCNNITTQRPMDRVQARDAYTGGYIHTIYIYTLLTVIVITYYCIGFEVSPGLLFFFARLFHSRLYIYMYTHTRSNRHSISPALDCASSRTLRNYFAYVRARARVSRFRCVFIGIFFLFIRLSLSSARARECDRDKMIEHLNKGGAVVSQINRRITCGDSRGVKGGIYIYNDNCCQLEWKKWR